MITAGRSPAKHMSPGLLLCGDAWPMRFEKNKNATLRGERLRFEATTLNNGQEVRQVDI